MSREIPFWIAGGIVTLTLVAILAVLLGGVALWIAALLVAQYGFEQSVVVLLIILAFMQLL